jgi:GDP/UDP-N,N'-diacetylbacillosamine 2-epimerase (hydrolysing)
MSSPRRIFVLTAARSEYDLLYPVLREMGRREGLRAELLVAGAHLSPFHGMGINEIRTDGFPIAATIESLVSSESWEGRSLSCAQLMEGLTRCLARDRPDVLFVAGDREEALAGALVANFFGIPVAHSHGGDRCTASDVDEVFRPAISKLAHLHFPAAEDHRQRLIAMGELPERVWTVGATGLDRLREMPDVPVAELESQYGVSLNQPFFMLIFHPASLHNPEDNGREMSRILEGMLSLGHPVFCSYPNFDPGNIAIRQAIDQARAKSDRLVVYHNLPREQFVSLYRRCAAIVGNSSSIVIEAGFLHVPGILVGTRQDRRTTGPNVLRVGTGVDEVRSACRRALEDETFREQVRTAPSLYGDGHAAPRIADVLAQVDLGRGLLLKTMPY